LFRGFVAPEEISLDGRGVKISFFLLQAAELPRPNGEKTPPPPDTSSIVRTAQRASSVSLSGAKVLWVDDNPDNNRYEREALAQLGLQFVIATSNGEALQQLRSQVFNAVITDFARKDDPEGGYTLLAEVKKTSPALPLIIYTGSFTAKQESEAKGRGAYGETNSPVSLFELVIDAIKGQ
jgi:CheY-like chemotaxis protein